MRKDNPVVNSLIRSFERKKRVLGVFELHSNE